MAIISISRAIENRKKAAESCESPTYSKQHCIIAGYMLMLCLTGYKVHFCNYSELVEIVALLFLIK